jgi:hypothetical protein
MLKVNNSEYLGQFKISSGKLRVSDPCYDRNAWLTGVLDDIKNGTWEAFIKLDITGTRVAELIAFHKDIPSKFIKNDRWDEQDLEIGVDSGQCGIFDDNHYPDEKGNANQTNSFYGTCCQLVKNDFGGVLDFGAVSSSGLGDGTYLCYTMEDHNGIIAVKVAFIEPEDEDGVEELEYDFEDDDRGYYKNEDDDY